VRDDCPLCLGYSEETQRRIDRAGRAHVQAMEAIRSVEKHGEGRAVVMGPTLEVSAVLSLEAERTATALGF